MATTRKQTRNGYPYKIPTFSGNPPKISILPPRCVNEYFLIEALLRSEPVMAAYNHGGKPALIAKFRDYGITDQDPLHGSHHKLLSPPGIDKALNKQLAKLGYVAMDLGILDLGILATLPPRVQIHHDNMILCGPTDGLADCLAYLQNRNPRFLCLRIDTRHPVKTIIDGLRPLLTEKHRQAQAVSLPAWLAFYECLKKTPVRTIKSWLDYLRCYDLFQNGESTVAAGEAVYGDNDAATEHANSAKRRVRVLIKDADEWAQAQVRASTKRIKQPTEDRPLWPTQKKPPHKKP